MPLGGRINAPSTLAADAVTGAKIADDAVDSEHYTDGSIDAAHLASDSVETAKIADNAVTLAKMAGLARGKFIYGDTSGDPAALAVGSANTLLGSDGTDISYVNVTSAMITDGTIVNADLNPSAAIAVSKTALTAGTNISLSTNTLNVDDAFLVNDGNDTTTGTITAAGLTTAGYITLSDDTPADDTGTGIVVTMTALTGLAVGELVHIDANGKLDQAHADAIADMPAIGIALTANSSGSDAEVNVLLLGIYRDDSQFNFTPGAPIYVSDTTEGDFIETAPSSDGDFVQRVGVAITADIIYFNPSMDVIEHA